MREVLILAGREIAEALRNRWFLAAALSLGGLAVALAFVGATPGGETRTAALAIAVANLSSLSVYLVPLLALLLSFDGLVGEAERGTLNLLLTYPVSRWQVVIGKFVGYLVVLGLALALGYGGAGVLVGYRGGSAEGWQLYAAMTGASLALGAAFLAVGCLVSALARERATAIGICIAVWLGLVVLYDLALLGLLVLDESHRIDQAMLGAALVVNPTDAYRLLTLASVDAVAAVSGMTGLAAEAGLGRPLLVASIGCWILAPLGLAVALFHRREV
ncbi:MAG: ABC transporter permease subunit [Ectothiorhodospiraceae bacterium]|nr:ABC transporter permease subunit [Chromatiales bacterium]MCP5153615.1 ABC transporter permease subunit [Ectothiorhodospiraceae bacterium]